MHTRFFPALFVFVLTFGIVAAQSGQDPSANAVRTAIRDGDGKAALSTLSSTQTSLTLPGLTIRAHEMTGDVARGCETAQQTKATTPAVDAAVALKLLRCTSSATSVRPLIARVMAAPSMARDALVLQQMHVELQRLNVDVALLKEMAAGVAVVTGDVPRREALADVLRTVAIDEKSKVVDDELFRRLMVDLAETGAAAAVTTSLGDKALATTLGDAGLLARARTLESHHANDALLATLAPIALASDDVSDRACEVRTLIGKTERKRRHYKASRAALDVVSNKCPEPWKKKALYTEARVAAFALTNDATSVVDTFLAQYPNDTLTDDVMVWKAEITAARGDHVGAAKIYRDVVARFPDGDMAFHARFTNAFITAGQGDASSAIGFLDEMSRAAARASPLIQDQALYWRARLEAYPHLDTYTPSADAARFEAGMNGLRALAVSRPASYYGQLAALMVARTDGADPRPLAKMPRTDFSQSTTSTGPMSASAKAATALYDAGFDDDAERVVDFVFSEGKERRTEDAEQAASLFMLLGRPDRAHQVMRAAGSAVVGGTPSDRSRTLWSLAYPRAHDDAITKATAKHKLPTAVLLALSREESAFDASVVSWAGAIGLCQLMPFTAREEAARAKLKAPTMEQLRTPALNADLGAQHLARRWTSLRHPLMAIAAYNAGPGNVAKWKAYKPVDAWVESIPVEQTRNYVKKVTGSWAVYTILDEGRGISFPLERP